MRGTRWAYTQGSTAIAAAFGVATTVGIRVAFQGAVAAIGRQLWARTWLVYVTADGHKLIVSGHIDGTLLGFGAGVSLARILADAALALRLILSWFATHSIGTALFAAFVVVVLAVAGGDFVGDLWFDGCCEK